MGSEFTSAITDQPYPKQDCPNGAVITLGAMARVSTATVAPTVLAPPSSPDGHTFAVADISSNAATNNITINGNGHTIDGAATATIDTNGAEVEFVFDGTEWKKVLPTRIFAPIAQTRTNSKPFTRASEAGGGGGGGGTPAAPPNSIQKNSNAGGTFASFGWLNPDGTGDLQAPSLAGQQVRNEADSAYLTLWRADAADLLWIGTDPTVDPAQTFDTIILAAKTAFTASLADSTAAFGFFADGASGTFSGPNLFVGNGAPSGGANAFGGGAGVIRFGPASPAPTTPEALSTFLYADTFTGCLKFMTPAGVIYDLCDVGVVVFDGGTPKNLRSNRPANQSPIENTANGIVNLSSDTSGTAGGCLSDWTTISGGDANSAYGTGATVGGGRTNVIEGDGAVIAGGESNTIGGSPQGNASTIGGGIANSISGDDNTIAGGNANSIQGDVDATGSTIGGGVDNLARGSGNVIGGGQSNEIRTAGGADVNTGSILGGNGNRVQANGGVALGGTANTAGATNSTVMGQAAQADNEGQVCHSTRISNNGAIQQFGRAQNWNSSNSSAGVSLSNDESPGLEIVAGQTMYIRAIFTACRRDAAGMLYNVQNLAVTRDGDGTDPGVTVISTGDSNLAANPPSAVTYAVDDVSVAPRAFLTCTFEGVDGRDYDAMVTYEIFEIRGMGSSPG